VTTIDFYFNATDRLQVACRLAGEALKQGSRLLIYAPDADTAGRLDTLMWTWPATGFVPHCPADDAIAADTPVLIGRTDDVPADCTLLLNLGTDAPPHFASFERLFEIVGSEEAEKESGRARYKLYRSRGYAIASHDLASHG